MNKTEKVLCKMSATPRSVGSEKRVSFAVRLEELSPGQIDVIDDSNNESIDRNNLSESDNQEPPTIITVNIGEVEEVEIPQSLSQLKQEVELSIPRAYTEDSATGKSRGPWSMGCFIDNLCAPVEMRGPEEVVLSSPMHQTEGTTAATENEIPNFLDVADDSNFMDNLEREEPPSSPLMELETTDSVAAVDETIDEDAFLPPDSEEAFLPPQDTTVGEEAFLPVNNPADESFLEAAFLPLDADESAFLPPFQEESISDNAMTASLPEEEPPKDKQEEPVLATDDSVTDESHLAGELVSEDPVPSETTCISTDDSAAAVDQQTLISQLEGQAEVEIEFTAVKEEEAVKLSSVEKDEEEGQDNKDEVVPFEVEDTTMGVDPSLAQLESPEGQGIEASECEATTAEHESRESDAVVEASEDVANPGEDCDPTISQNDSHPDCSVNTGVEANEELTNSVMEYGQTASSPEKTEIAGTMNVLETTEDQEDTEANKPSLNSEEMPAEEVEETERENSLADQSIEKLVGGQDNGNNDNNVADEYPVLSMEYTQSMNTDFANNEHENASDDGSRDEVIEELRILLAKSQEEKQKAVEQAVKETEVRLSRDSLHLSEGSVKEVTEVASDTKPQQQNLQQQQPTASAQFAVESTEVEERKPEPVVQIAGAMKVASVIKTRFSDDQDAGDISTLKNSLGSLLKNQKETIQSLRLKLGERDRTIEEMEIECNSVKEKYKVTQSSLTFAEKTLISVKAERTTAKTETKAAIEKMNARILEVEMSMETAKKIRALEQEQSTATIATLKASLTDTNAALDLANAQLVIMEEQQGTIKKLESSLQDANNSVKQAQADSAQVEGQLKVLIEVLKLEAAEKEKQVNQEIEQAKVDFAKAERQLKETIATSRQEYEEMRLLCNQQSSDIMARESTIVDLQDQIAQIETSKIEKEKSNETLLQENQRLNGLVEKHQLTIASKERSLGELQQEIRDLVESVQNADSLREELQTEHEQSISLLNEKVKSLSMDCESLKSMVSLKSNDSENSDINSMENAKEDSNDEVVDPMFCAASKSGEETANSGKSLVDQEIGAITTMPSRVCKEQFKKMDSTVHNETKSKMSSFNQKISSLTCGCVAGSSLEFPDNENLAGSNSLVDANPEEVFASKSSDPVDPSPETIEARNNEEIGVQASQSSDSVGASSVDNRMAGVMFEGEDDAVEAVLHLEKYNYTEDLSLLKSKSSSSDISSKESSDSAEKGNISMDLAEYVDGGDVVPMTKKLESLGGELIKTLSEAKEKESSDAKDSGLAVDKVGIFKAAFKNFQSEKEKLLKDAEVEKNKALEEMRAQLEEEKRAFIEEQEKRYGSSKTKTATLSKEPVKATSSKKPSASRTKSKSPVRQTTNLSHVSGSPTIEKARASLRPTRGVVKPKVVAPRVPLYLRSSGEVAKKVKEQTSSTKSFDARSASVPKARARKPSAIRAPSPTALRPSSLRGTRTSSIRAPSPTSSRPSSLRAPSPGATRLPASTRAPSPGARRSSIRAPSPTGLGGPASGSFRKGNVSGTGKVQPPKTNSLRASKLGKPKTGGSSRLQSLADQKMAAKQATLGPSVEISSLEDSFSSLKKKQQSMTPRKAAPEEEEAVQHGVMQENTSPSEDSSFDKRLEKVDSEQNSVDNVEVVKSTDDGPTNKSEESKNGGEDEDSAVTNTSPSNKEETGVEIVFRRPESQETVESTNNAEKRTSVPECLDLLNAEISNSDCDLEDESEEEDGVLNMSTNVLSDDPKEEAREEDSTPQRSELCAAREEATSNEKLSDKHDAVNSEQNEERAEVDVTLPKVNKLGPEVDARKVADV